MFDRVRALAGILTETGVGEIEVTEGTLRIRVAASSSAAPCPTVAALAPAVPLRPALPAQPGAVADPPLVIRAPMHGVFHRAPGPGAPPFVELGTTVAPGQTVGVLEAMKVFSPVLATEAGVVAAFGAGNADDVAAGQVLLTLAPVP